MKRFFQLLSAMLVAFCGGSLLLTANGAFAAAAVLECPLKDWRCLLQKAADYTYNTKDVMWDGGSRADDLFKVIEHYPAGEQQEKLDYFIAHPFNDEMAKWLIKFRFKKFPGIIDVAKIEAAINQQAAPIANIRLDDYLKVAFKQLFAAKDVDTIDMLINKYYGADT